MGSQSGPALPSSLVLSCSTCPASGLLTEARVKRDSDVIRDAACYGNCRSDPCPQFPASDHDETAQCVILQPADSQMDRRLQLPETAVMPDLQNTAQLRPRPEVPLAAADRDEPRRRLVQIRVEVPWRMDTLRLDSSTCVDAKGSRLAQLMNRVRLTPTARCGCLFRSSSMRRRPRRQQDSQARRFQSTSR